MCIPKKSAKQTGKESFYLKKGDIANDSPVVAAIRRQRTRTRTNMAQNFAENFSKIF